MNVVDLIVVFSSVLELILDRAGLMGGLHVLRVLQALKVVTESQILREVSGLCVKMASLMKVDYIQTEEIQSGVQIKSKCIV